MSVPFTDGHEAASEPVPIRPVWTFQDILECFAFGHIRKESLHAYRKANPLFDRWLIAKARAVRKMAQEPREITDKPE